MQFRPKRIQELSCKQPSSSVRSGPLGHYYSLLVLPLPPPPTPASPLLKEPRKHQGLGKLVCLPFSDCSEDGWFLFRRAYAVCCQINNWDDLRSRRELLLALKDGALAKIANLQPTPDPLPVDWNIEAFLDQIEGKFVHQVDTFRAGAEYTQARQLKEEDVGTWHTCVLQLHTRAWHGAVDRDMSHELIYTFCCGLYHELKQWNIIQKPSGRHCKAPCRLKRVR
jgi:hypothetical protein